MRYQTVVLGLLVGLMGLEVLDAETPSNPVPENIYRGQLVQFPGPWAFQIPNSSIILVSDKEFETLANPDQVLNLSLFTEPQMTSLRQLCEAAKALLILRI